MSRLGGIRAFTAALALAVGASAPASAHSPGEHRAAAAVTFSPAAAPGGPFTLVDHRGGTVTDVAFRGKFMLVVFGYTSCPDICPTTLQSVAEAMDRLGPLAARVQPLFVTLDPERDGPEVLAHYVRAFDPRIVGLTGTPAEIEQVARAYRIVFQKVTEKAASEANDAADYSVDHNAFIYLMGPDGSYVTHFSHGVAPERMAREIGGRVKRAP